MYTDKVGMTKGPKRSSKTIDKGERVFYETPSRYHLPRTRNGRAIFGRRGDSLCLINRLGLKRVSQLSPEEEKKLIAEWLDLNKKHENDGDKRDNKAAAPKDKTDVVVSDANSYDNQTKGIVHNKIADTNDIKQNTDHKDSVNLTDDKELFGYDASFDMCTSQVDCTCCSCDLHQTKALSNFRPDASTSSVKTLMSLLCKDYRSVRMMEIGILLHEHLIEREVDKYVNTECLHDWKEYRRTNVESDFKIKHKTTYLTPQIFGMCVDAYIVERDKELRFIKESYEKEQGELMKSYKVKYIRPDEKLLIELPNTWWYIQRRSEENESVITDPTVILIEARSIEEAKWKAYERWSQFSYDKHPDDMLRHIDHIKLVERDSFGMITFY